MAAPPTNPHSSNGAALSTAASSEARHYACAVASWYANTIDPYAPHAQNVESRLRHPVHVVTRRILYGNCDPAAGASVHGEDGLEALFNDDDAEIRDGPATLTRRSAARMEAFLASCSVALRAEEGWGMVDGMGKIGDDAAAASTAVDEGKGKNGKDKKKNKQAQGLDKPPTTARTTSGSSAAPRICRQIDRGELQLRLNLYCRT